MFSKAAAIGFLATPGNSRDTLNENKDSFLVQSLAWFRKAQYTFLEDFEKIISSGKEPDPDFKMWSSDKYQVLLRMIVDNFERKIPENSSTEERFLSHTELITLYAVMLSFNPNDADDADDIKAGIMDNAQHFRNNFSKYFESTDAGNLIYRHLPEVRVWLTTLNQAERILHNINPGYRSILIRLKNSKLLELDAELSAVINDYESLVSQGSSKAPQGSGCLGVIVCAIIVVYSLIV